MTELRSISWTLECDPLAATPPVLTYVHAEEELSAPYDLRLTGTVGVPDLDLTELLGKNAVLVLERLPLTRRFCGVIQEVEAEDAASLHGLVFSLRIRPAFHLLSMRRDSRIFQNQTVPQIVEAVLKEGLAPYEREVKLELTETYPTREYCVQYQETDLEFVSRLLQEEGIHYAFDHEGDVEVMVLRDTNAAFAKVATTPEEGVLEYHADDRVVTDREWVGVFQLVRQNTETHTKVRDQIFTREDLVFDAEQGENDALGRKRESYEHGSSRSVCIYDYDQGVRRYRQHDAERQAKIRTELFTRDAVKSWTAESNAVGLTAGTTFELRGHPTVGVDGEYLVTRVRHRSVAAGEAGYGNDFHCIPLETTFRPDRAARKPRIPSIQTAIVTGPAGEEIHVDEYGRVKVQFYWDRQGQRDEKTSCWVRTQQTWAGNGWGTWWVPRIGMEVVVQFVDGDPDRPLVTGCVYNADNQLPYALPDEKTKSTIKSNSSLGGGGFNEFRFEDKKGQEEIWLHAQKDLNEKVLNDHTLNVGNNETIEIGVDQTQTIGNNQVEHVKANQTMTVDANRTVAVGGNFEETVTGNETRTVSGAVTETITSGETVTVSAGRTTTVNGGFTETVNGGVTRSVNGAVNESFTGAWNATVLANINITTPATINVVAPSHTTTDTDWSKVGKLCNGVYALTMSATGVKLDATGLAVGATGVRVGVTGIKIENKGASFEDCKVAVKAIPSYVRSGALALYLYGATMMM